MNLYRYRVVERTITTIIAGNSTERSEYYVQQSLLGIMWVDMVDKHSIPYWAFPQGAIEQYNKLTKKQIIKDKVVHPIKQTK
jgi:hypothetical protein